MVGHKYYWIIITILLIINFKKGLSVVMIIRGSIYKSKIHIKDMKIIICEYEKLKCLEILLNIII